MCDLHSQHSAWVPFRLLTPILMKSWTPPSPPPPQPGSPPDPCVWETALICSGLTLYRVKHHWPPCLSVWSEPLHMPWSSKLWHMKGNLKVCLHCMSALSSSDSVCWRTPVLYFSVAQDLPTHVACASKVHPRQQPESTKQSSTV